MSIFRLGDQKPPEPQRITDGVVDALRARLRGRPRADGADRPAGHAGLGHASASSTAAGSTWTGCTTTSPTTCCSPARSRDMPETDAGRGGGRDGQRDALELLHAAGLSAAGLDRHDQDRGRARVLRRLLGRRDLAQGPLGAVRRRGRQDRAHPLRPERHARVPARADADLPAAGDARRAHRRAHGARRLDRQLRAAARSTASTGRARSRCRASRRRIHVMRTFLDDGAITSRATSSSTTASSRSRGRCRSASRSRWAA